MRYVLCLLLLAGCTTAPPSPSQPVWYCFPRGLLAPHHRTYETGLLDEPCSPAGLANACEFLAGQDPRERASAEYCD